MRRTPYEIAKNSQSDRNSAHGLSSIAIDTNKSFESFEAQATLEG